MPSWKTLRTSTCKGRSTSWSLPCERTALRLDDLTARADASHDRADRAAVRADASQERADVAERRADTTEGRVDELEAHSALDRVMLAELQADGTVSRENVAQLEAALVASRVIGAAVGILMASRNVGQDEAFAILRAASSRNNVKLRDLAETIVDGADAIK